MQLEEQAPPESCTAEEDAVVSFGNKAAKAGGLTE
jgi:hypothetical protein